MSRWLYVATGTFVAILIAIGVVAVGSGSNASFTPTPMSTLIPSAPVAAQPALGPKPPPVGSPTGVNPEHRLVGVLNPAVTQATIKNTICVSSWTKSIRPSVTYTNALKRSQLSSRSNPADYEEDHLMPLELGGAPMDVRNLRPILWTVARTDDTHENQLHRLVCAGSMTLAVAQTEMSIIKYGEDR
jgi:hypothetical protein